MALHTPHLFAPSVPRLPVLRYTAPGEVYTQAVTAEVECAASVVAKEHQSLTEYVRLSTWLIGALPVVYGVFTWVYGTSLWSNSPVYPTALTVPMAPQSWGTVFIVLGVLSVWCAETRRYAADAVFSMATAVILASFMCAFVLEYVGQGMRGAIPPATSYALFSLLYMNRARLSWKFRRR